MIYGIHAVNHSNGEWRMENGEWKLGTINKYDMKKILVILGATVMLLCPCCILLEEKLDESLTKGERINKFIVDGVQTYYLWEAETDWKKYDDNETFTLYDDHYELFDQLLSKEDPWSTLTDDFIGLEKQFEGVSTTFGYTLAFYYNPFEKNDEVIAIVLFITPGSPAAKAGMKRGDVIVEMNGNKLTDDNYKNLYTASSLQIRCGQVDVENKVITLLQPIISLTAIEMYENPIYMFKIIEKTGKKIGYLCYTGFQRESENELIQLFSDFKSANVTEVVLDLRYNPGGFSRTAQLLSSILVPEQEVKKKSIYLEHYYNNLYTQYLKKNGHDLYETFVDTLPVNMNLSRLYVLSSSNTASASEATIVGLNPYMQVVQIGDTTSGKYCGGVLLSPEDIYGEKNKPYFDGFANWGMYIMIYRYANINGLSSFSSGLVPDLLAKENPFDLKPLGDEDDPLLGRALADIMGVSYIEPRSAKIAMPLSALPAPKKLSDGLLIATPPQMIVK